jgi:hypothetical protein
MPEIMSSHPLNICIWIISVRENKVELKTTNLGDPLPPLVLLQVNLRYYVERR